MLEIDAKGKLKRNGWAAGRVGEPISELLPAEEELIELWEGLRARARGVQASLFQVTGAVSSPDLGLVSALVRFVAPKGSTEKTAQELSYSLLGLEQDLQQIHPDVFLEQVVEDGRPMPEFGLLVRISSTEQLPAATEVMQELAWAIRDTRIGEFAAEQAS